MNFAAIFHVITLQKIQNSGSIIFVWLYKFHTFLSIFSRTAKNIQVSKTYLFKYVQNFERDSAIEKGI